MGKFSSSRARFTILGVLGLLWVTQSLCLMAQAPPSSRQRRLRAIPVQEPIVVDGEFRETSWGRAEAAGDFLQQEPETGAPTTEPTLVRVLFDEENIYFGVWCYDSGGPEALVVNDINRDFYQFDSDSFGMMIDTFDDDRNGFLFNTNPQGAKFDSQVGGDGSIFNREWDAVWHVKSKITEQGWQAEIAIPFRSLRFNKSGQQLWGLNFQRRIRRKNEDTYWALPPQPFSMSRVSIAGTLEGIQNPPGGRNLHLKPFLSTPLTKVAGDDWAFKPEVGLDLKYGLTSQLTLDLTLNTDFAQVEADNQQINLTRFSLFFPEKRSFFLENAPIFQFGRQGGRFRRVAGRFDQVRGDVIPFFSRRIGISAGRMIPVLGGARVTGRSGPFTLGLFSIQTQREEQTPTSNFSVVRVRRDVFSNSDIGGIFINKEVSEGENNRTYGLDGNLTFFRRMDVTVFLLKTDTPGIHVRDWAGNVSVFWTDPKLQIEAQHVLVGENFNPEVGFVPRRGIRKSFGRVAWTPRPGEAIPWIREFMPLVSADYITDDDDPSILLTRRYETRLWVEFQNSSRLSIGHETFFERLTEPFLIRTDQSVPVGDYTFSELSMTFSTDQSRRLSGEFRLNTGEFFDGERDSYRLAVSFRQAFRFLASLSWEHNDISLSSGEFSTDLLITRLQYAFSNNLFLKALIQYNSEEKTVSSNIRLNLIHRPLSDFFLIYNEKRSTTGEVAERALIAKLTYDFTF